MAGTRKVKRGTGTLSDRLNATATMPEPPQDDEPEPEFVDAGKEQDGAATDVSEGSSSTDPVVSPDAPVDGPETAVDATEARPWMLQGDHPRDGLIVGPGEPIKASGTINGSTVVLDQRIYRAFRHRGSVRYGFKLMYAANARIPLSQLALINGKLPEPNVVNLPDKLSSGNTVTLPRSA